MSNILFQGRLGIRKITIISDSTGGNRLVTLHPENQNSYRYEASEQNF